MQSLSSFLQQELLTPYPRAELSWLAETLRGHKDRQAAITILDWLAIEVEAYMKESRRGKYM